MSELPVAPAAVSVWSARPAETFAALACASSVIPLGDVHADDENVPRAPWKTTSRSLVYSGLTDGATTVVLPASWLVANTSTGSVGSAPR